MARHRLLPLTIAMMVAVGVSRAEDAPVALKLSMNLTVYQPKATIRDTPIFFDAASITNMADGSVVVDGKVSARTLGESFQADWVRYDPKRDELFAKGNVVIQQGDRRMETPSLHLRMTEQVGEAESARFLFPTKGGLTGRGEAGKISLAGPDRYQLESASFTTCPAGNDDWYLRTDKLDLDYVDQVGQARDVKIEYLGTPILYAPWLDFALDDSRKSGFLTPTLGVSDDRGLEVMAPWYWNIAANRDATFTPRLMSKRGMQLGSEFRYLDADYHGQVMIEALPEDSVYGSGRYRGRVEHEQVFGPHLTGELLFDDVSDDTYFIDLSSMVSQTSQGLLPRHAALTYDGDWWKLVGRVENYQVLQDPTSPIPPDKLPYDRLPQVLLNMRQPHLFGDNLRFNMASELVRFEHDVSTNPVGNRFYAYPSVEANFEQTYGYIRPKVGWHYTVYDLDRNPDPTAPTTLWDTSLTRSLPIFTLDSGAYLERDWSLGGHGFLQTLEPRFYYVRIPYKDQSQFPVFDSSVADLFQTQLFSENQFIGIDRINDADQITLGVTSRLLEPDTGLERLQVTVGQRYYFNDQRVTMPGYVVRGSNVTDLLAQVSGQVTDRWRVDSGIQYNPDDAALARANLGVTYRSGPGKLVNLDLRYINDDYGTGLNQLDLSWQWPIQQQWYALGRINYSFYDDRLVEGLLGFEHNAGCWALRGVVQKLATTTANSSLAFFLQLELRGLTQLGPNPLDVLKRSITGYTKSDEVNLP